MKKIIALVLALALVMMVGGAAFAADYAGSVSVSGLAENDEATFYKIIEWVGEAEDNVKGWKAVSTYASVLTKEVLTEVLLGTAKANTDPVEYENPTGITPELAGQLAKLAASGTKVDVGANKIAKLDVTAPGTYMVLVKPADVNTVYNPIFVSSDWDTKVKEQAADHYGDDPSTAKKSTLTLTKTASTTEDSWDDQSSSTTAVGDTVTFTVKATIPAYSDVYDNPSYVMTDTLNALKLVSGSVSIAGGLKKDVDYSVDEESDGSGYTITFSKDYLKSIKSATEVTVTYNAKVTTDAKYSVNEETNEVMVKFSNNPANESDYDVKKDTTQHYTFTIDGEADTNGVIVKGKKTSEIVKVGVKPDGTPITETTETSEITSRESWKGPLQGAIFGLYTDAKCETPYYPKDKDGTLSTEPLKATTGADGRMTFAGLDAGTYYIKEDQAPDGYVMDTQIVKVEIIATTKEVSVTEWWNGTAWVSEKPTSGVAKEYTYKTDKLESYTVKINEHTAASYKFHNPDAASSNEIQWEISELEEHPYPFTNTKGVQLPSTGGIGTTIFYILGGLLVVGAAVILVARRKAQD